MGDWFASGGNKTLALISPNPATGYMEGYRDDMHENYIVCARAFTHTLRAVVTLQYSLFFVYDRTRPIVSFSSGKACSKGNV